MPEGTHIELVNVELVRIVTEDGVRLAGTLRAPVSPETNSLPIDVMIFHHGVGGNFYTLSFVEQMGDAFLDRGCAVLRVNNRGHDLAYNSPVGRLGSAFESVDDCRIDLKAWTDFAVSRGYGRVGLWGHSLGAVKTIYFLAADGDERVTRAVASSPPRFSHAAFLAQTGSEAFRAYYDRAKRLVDEGNGDALFTADIPTSLVMTARTYLDKYGPDERYDVLKHLPNVQTPLLVTIGGEEGVHADRADRFGFGGLAEQVSALASDQPNLQFALIEGADHQYTDRTDQLWTRVDSWLNGPLVT